MFCAAVLGRDIELSFSFLSFCCRKIVAQLSLTPSHFRLYLIQAQLDQNKTSTVEETKNPFVTQLMIFVDRVLLQRVTSTIAKALK